MVRPAARKQLTLRYTAYVHYMIIFIGMRF